MEKTKKPTTPAKAPAAAKPVAVAIKPAIEKNLKDSAKLTDAICDIITKKVLAHKSASSYGMSDVNGFGKADVMKLIGMLDGMGSSTYKTACALRELHEKMR